MSAVEKPAESTDHAAVAVAKWRMIRKVLPFAALSIGVAFTIWLVVAANVTSIVQSFAQIGWGIAAIVGVRATMITVNGLAWRQVLARLSTFSVVSFHYYAGSVRPSTYCCRSQALAVAW